jgi:hypothetical protein
VDVRRPLLLPVVFTVLLLTAFCTCSEEAFGGRNIATSNTFFSNGNVDPWHALGITTPFARPMPNSDVFYIDGTAHCADLYPPSPKDVPGLTAARKRFVQLLNIWLSTE